ncbi:hypothetical protein SOCE26_056100 [Sorangium cellulosum]|uniref:Amine oxidase domain-containing protein n=1 Tax=Sorangium cellulosum TaxID=56 RepID=A0A2L0EXW4_SORCE|nr:FAD-dependent oxidoreductase [Sorangium cellulosum]AUX44147.1 hypothetical protein SOCE26_056100 [Sorangium cellulosum]
MDEPPLRAVVIGAGVGGAAAALLLARAGIPTLLAERARRVGGSAAYERDGFRVDAYTHMLCRGEAGPLGDVLRRAGHADAITFREGREPAALAFAGAARGARGGGPRARRAVVPGELRRLAGFARDLARGLELGPLEAARAARLVAHAASMRDVDLAACDDVTAEQYVARFLARPAAAAGLAGLLALPLLLPGAEASAGEALFALRQIARGGPPRYPEGGAGRVPDVFSRLAQELGAAVWTSSTVRRVLVRDRRVCGVELADGTAVAAGIVVSTADLPTTVSALVGEAHFPEAYVARVRALRPAPRRVEVKIGLRRRLVAASALAGLDGGEGASPSPFYGVVPTSFDPSLAPPGHELLCASAVASGASVDGLVRALDRAVPGLLADVVFVDGSPAGSAEAPGMPGGERAAGTAQVPGQVGRARPAVHTPVRGLYLAGRAAGGRGVGMELAASSAIECVDRILVDLGRDLGAPPRPELADIAGDLLERAAASTLSRLTR